MADKTQESTPEIEAPIIESPISATTQEPVVEDEPNGSIDNVKYRKFDSDDVMRLRGSSIMRGLETGKVENVVVDTGQLQKATICLGVRSCDWFNDVINEQYGVTHDIFSKRMSGEFRRIPTEFVDRMLKEVTALNKNKVDLGVLKKK